MEKRKYLALLLISGMLQACVGDVFTSKSTNTGDGGDASTDTGTDTGVGGTGGSVSDGGTDVGGMAGKGGMAGSAGSSGGDAGGLAGQGGMAGMAGSGGSTGGTAGQGGSGGSPPCETGVYLTVDSQSGTAGVLSLGSGAGNVTSTVYLVHGTDVNNKFTGTITIVNNLAGNFASASAQTTVALESIRVRCEDPVNPNSFTGIPCDLSFANSDKVDCVFQASDNCYNVAGQPMKLQLQVNPVAAGQARIGLDPATVKLCDVQDNPLINVQ